MKSATAYPLSWPDGWKRAVVRDKARFTVSFEQARAGLTRELDLMGARGIVLSTNIPVRLDGYPYAKHAPPSDPGVAIYFTIKDRQICMACDRWNKVQDNIQALHLSVAALRGIDRWGCSSFLDRAFTGFQALPPSAEAARKWWDVLGVDMYASPEEVRDAYLALSRRHHPDKGGDPVMMARINNAYDEARRVQ